MAAEIVRKWFVREVESVACIERRIRFIDGTHVQEQGVPLGAFTIPSSFHP